MVRRLGYSVYRGYTLARLNSTGNVIWEDVFDGGTVFEGNYMFYGDECFDFTIDPSGNIYAVGKQRDIGNTHDFGVIRAYDSSGDLLYHETVNDLESYWTRIPRVVMNDDDELVITVLHDISGEMFFQKRNLSDGSFIEEFQPFDPGVMTYDWYYADWNHPGVDLDDAGNMVVAGWRNDGSSFLPSYVQAWDSDFNEVWGFEHPPAFAFALAMDQNGEDVWVGGGFDYDSNEVRKYSRTGTLLAHGFMDLPDDGNIVFTRAIEIDPSGGVYAAGHIGSPGEPFIVYFE